MDEATLARFEAKYILLEGCWHWVGAKLQSGYGRFKVASKVVQAHLASYEHFIGPVPEGLELDHLCRNRACVNPFHLEPVTRSENVLRGDGPLVTRLRHQQRTHCPKGHPYDEKNTYLWQHPKGYMLRDCRACTNERRREKRRRDANIT